ncbi:amidohydrolase family protein [Taylorella equigenitalis]|uniref:amidohydrolase family protein n=1 Tax=Taylorella equigenitalis TaxID=29575 RepID=UPI000405771E|nr:amidohydrolase family protein [Taylorella equigenitalis]ASY29993.1 metal-dependent hydrolase [Taylorella equigenitalis]KOS59039.1 metal-dependent hydrolase [Taylorella equigenitalis]
MVIDTHAHAFLTSLKSVSDARYVPHYDASLAMYLDQLDSNGVEKGVLVQPSFLGTDNSYLIECLRNSDRLRGIVVVDPVIEIERLKEFDEYGVVGVRQNLIGKQIPEFQSLVWHNHLAALETLGWQLEFQRNITDLPPILEALKGYNFNIVIDHLGCPNKENVPGSSAVDEIVNIAKRKKNLWFKVSGWYRAHVDENHFEFYASLFEYLVEKLGPECFVWGSDWPHTNFEHEINYKKSLEFINRLIKDDHLKEKILFDNPKRLFKF